MTRYPRTAIYTLDFITAIPFLMLCMLEECRSNTALFLLVAYVTGWLFCWGRIRRQIYRSMLRTHHDI